MADPATCLVIPRVAPRSEWPAADRPAIDLFLPTDRANRGHIACWDGCHSEASMYFYFVTTAPRTPAEREAADALVARYRAFIASIPAEDQQVVEVRERLPRNWQALAWGPLISF